MFEQEFDAKHLDLIKREIDKYLDDELKENSMQYGIATRTKLISDRVIP
ncbi:MAG: hypothetical protein ACXAEN_18340 [Candidatus Thorarchaeota archaeon]|jgi:hypothetical protein